LLRFSSESLVLPSTL